MTHPLDPYLQKTEQSQSAFARRVGVSPHFMSRVIAGIRYPSRKTAERIEVETDGAVTAADLLLWKPEQEAQTP